MTLTPDQVKAGRQLLGWTRARLSARVGARVAVSENTIRRYEAGEGAAATLDLVAVRQVLESAGVEFIADLGGRAGVRLRKATK
jgi:transcriptional regulator with XRE-family HTH domain